MHINELCDPQLVSAVVRQYIPDAVLKGQKKDELCFRLPLENTDSFPGKKLSLCQGFKGKPSGKKSRNQSYCERNKYIPWSIMCGIRNMHKYHSYRKPEMNMLILIMKMKKSKSTN